MTDEAAFLARICGRPDDDVARLVFADWLEEHGQADRARFIRRQVEDPHSQIHFAARQLPSGRWSWSVRAASVKGRGPWRKGARQAGNLPGWGPDALRRTLAVVRRGFVEEIRAPLEILRSHLPRLLGAAPVSRVTVSDRDAGRFDTTAREEWTWYLLRENERLEGDDAAAAYLPRPVFSLLAGHLPHRLPSAAELWRDYPSQDAATAAISVALLAEAAVVAR